MDYRNHPLYKRHDLDSAMNSSWEFYKRNFVSLFIISFVFTILTQLAASSIDLSELQTMTDPEMIIDKMSEYFVPALLAGLLSLLLNLIMQHFIIFQPLDEKNNILTSTIKSLRYFLPFLVIMVLFAFAGAIGMVLGILALVIGVFFVILYLFTLYLFFLPLLMIEGPHIGNTISRSFSLFHRNFWQNIGLTGIFLIIIIVLSVILSSIIMLPFAGSFMKNIFNPGETEATDFRLNPVFIVLSALAGAFTFPLMPILSCVLYFNGRAEEDQQVETAPAEYRPTIDDLYGRPRDRNTEENN